MTRDVFQGIRDAIPEVGRDSSSANATCAHPGSKSRNKAAECKSRDFLIANPGNLRSHNLMHTAVLENGALNSSIQPETAIFNPFSQIFRIAPGNQTGHASRGFPQAVNHF